MNFAEWGLGLWLYYICYPCSGSHRASCLGFPDTGFSSLVGLRRVHEALGLDNYQRKPKGATDYGPCPKATSWEKGSCHLVALRFTVIGERTFTLSLGLGQDRRQLKKIVWLTILGGLWALPVSRTLPYKYQKQVSFLWHFNMWFIDTFLTSKLLRKHTILAPPPAPTWLFVVVV